VGAAPNQIDINGISHFFYEEKKMKHAVKKSISITLLLSVLASAAILPAKRAEAIVGLATANPVVAILGLAAIGGGGVTIAVLDASDNSQSVSAVFGAAFSAVAAGIVGITLLDDKNSQDVAFAPITSAEAATTIGLSNAELAAYNNEIDTINLIREDVASQVQNESQQDVTKASSLWTQYQNDLSPEAFAAVQKVAQAAVQSAAAQR
jgi:hypothetical protein